MLARRLGDFNSESFEGIVFQTGLDWRKISGNLSRLHRTFRTYIRRFPG
jgi:hypothetical protein